MKEMTRIKLLLAWKCLNLLLAIGSVAFNFTLLYWAITHGRKLMTIWDWMWNR